MTGDQLRKLRRRLGLSVLEFGRLLGYAGNDRTVSRTLRRYESGKQPIPFIVTEAELREEMRRDG